MKLALLSVALAAAVSALAWRVRALNASGAAAATLVGAVVFGFGGLAWALALIAFFVAASLLSFLGRGLKQRRLGAFATGGSGARNARQVLANGTWAALAALGAGLARGELSGPWGEFWSLAFFGSLAAASADTWATELGLFAPGLPRSIRSWQRVPPGTSGGVTWLGSGAAVGGAAFVGAVAYALDALQPQAAAAVALAGTAGAFADSWLGATIQVRFRCTACGAVIESARHAACDSQATRISGLRPVDNDVINLLASGVGAVGAAFFFW